MRNVKKDLRHIVITMYLAIIIMTPNLTTLSVYAGVPDEPHEANAMWVEPSMVDLSTDHFGIGDTFNVTVWVNITSVPSGNDEVGSWQFRLWYKKDILDVIAAAYTAGTKSQFFEDINTFPLAPTFGTNGTHSYVQHSEMWNPLIPAPNPKKSIPASGSLTKITFNITDEPPEGGSVTSSLYLDRTLTKIEDDVQNRVDFQMYDGLYTLASPSAPAQYTLTIASTSGGTTNPSPGAHVYEESTVVPVTAIADSGYMLDHWELDSVNVGNTNPYDVTMNSDHTIHAFFLEEIPSGETTLSVDPSNITDPDIEPSQTFNINITIANVTNLKICRFNLSYNPDKVGWKGINVFKVQDLMPSANAIIDDDVGFIWMELTYDSPVTTAFSPLINVEFHVESVGCTPLDLHDSELINSTDESIPHQTIDGMFCSVIRDIAITEVSPSTDWVYAGWELTVNVTARNEGNLTETFTVTAYYNDHPIGDFLVENLPQGEETEVVLIWDTQNVTPCGNYTISARAPILPDEEDTADNEYIDGKVKVRIEGDVNGDDAVDITDLYWIGLAFGSEPGDEEWNPAADLDQNLVIDISDLYYAAMNYGLTCPLP